MSFCPIDNNDDLLSVYRYVRESIENNIKEKTSIDPKAIAKELYDYVLEESKDKDKALSYAHLIPDMLRQAAGASTVVSDYMTDINFDLNSNNKLAKSWRTAPDLNSVAEYIGVEQVTKEDVKDAAEIAGQQTAEDEVQDKLLSTWPETVSYAVPESFLTTTGQEGVRNVKDPAVAMFYTVLRNMVRNNMQIKGYSGEVHLSTMAMSRIPENMLDSRQTQEFRENPLYAMGMDKIFVQVLTDAQGNFLMFDTSGNYTETNGKPVYFFVRTDIKTVQAPKTEQNAEAIMFQKNAMDAVLSTIAQDPANNIFINTLTGGSVGFLQTGDDVSRVSDLDQTIYRNLSFKRDAQNTVYITSPTMNKDVPIFMDAITEEEALEMADFLLNPISYELKGKTTLLKESDKKNFFFFLPSGSSRIALVKNGENLQIKIDGKTVDLKTPDARNIIADAIVNNTDGNLYLYKNNMTIVRTFSNVRQSPDGTYTANIEKINYSDFIRQHSYTAQAIENGDFVPFNAYFEFMIGPMAIKGKTKEVEVETPKYKGVPIVEKSVTSGTGEPGGAQYSRTENTIYINKPVLQSKFETKAWTTPRTQKDGSVVEAYPEDMFKTYEEWEAFVTEHEYQHSLLSRKEFDKSVSGTTTTADYENEINKRALKELGMSVPEVKVEPVVSTIETIKNSGLIDPSLLLRNGRKLESMAAAEDMLKNAIPWFNSITLPNGKKLSSVVPLTVMFNAVNADPSVVAHWNMAGITLWKGSDASDLYHESWHMFSQIFLTAKEREELYKSIGGLKGSFTNYKGQKVEFKNATKLEKEEWLAEQFREHMLRGGKGKYSKGKGVIANIINKIYDILSYFFNGTTIKETQADYAANAAISEMFDKLGMGKLGNPVFEPDATFVETGLNKIKGMSASDTSIVVKSMTGMLSEATDQLNETYNTKGLTVGIISEEGMRKAAYMLMQEKLINRVQTLKDKVETTKGSRKLKAERQLALVSWMLDNLGDVNNPKEGDTLLSYYEKNVINEFEPDMADKDDNTTSRSEYADKSGNEVSVKNMIDKKLIHTLSSLIQYKENGNVEKDALGFPKLVQYRQALNLIMNITQGARTPKEIYDALVEVEELFPIVKAFLKKVGNPDNVKGDLENSMWGQITKLFSLPRITIVNLDIEQTLNKEGAIERITVRPGDASRENSKVFKLFNSKFVRSGEEPYRIKSTATGAVVINVDQLALDLYNSPNSTTLTEINKKILQDPIAFLNAIGLYVPELKVIRDVLQDKKTGMTYEVNGLKNKVRAIYAFNNWVKANGNANQAIVLSRVTDLLDKNIDDLIPNKNLRESFLQQGQFNRATFNAFTGFKKSLADLYLHWTGDFSNSTVTTTTGKTKYENSLPNTITKKTDLINNAINYEDLVKDNTENTNGMPIYIANNLSLNKNSWMKNSMLMNILFDMNSAEKIKREGTSVTGKAITARINILDMDGTKMRIGQERDLVGFKSSDSDINTKMLQDFFMMMIYGTSEATRHAGKSSTFLYQIIHADGSKHYVDPKLFASENATVSTGKSKTRDAYMGYMASEIERIYKARTNSAFKNVLIGGSKMSFAEAGSKFVMFDDILTEDQKNDLYKLIDNGTLKTSEDFKVYLEQNVKSREELQKQVNDYLEDQYKQVYDKFFSEGVISSRHLLSPTILKIVGDPSTINRDQLVRQVIEAYTANQLLHNIETGIVYYGDPAIYNHLKEEYHKRNAGIGSTGQTPRTDIHFQNFINRPDKKGKYAESAWYKGPKTREDGTTVGQRDYNGTFNSAVLDDVKSTSVYLNEYKKAAKEKETKRLKSINASEETIKEALKNIDTTFDEAYSGMKEGDAQGWISFDSYRLLMRGLDKWTTKHEKLYNKILNKEDISADDLSNFFPIKKMQYWGTLATEEVAVEAFHKFSLMPLIPTLIEGTKLEQLHNKMVEKDIDYAVFSSGSKLGTVTNNGKFDKFYDNDQGWLALNEPGFDFAKNVVYMDYLKDQVEVAPKFKEKIIFSTQLRKLVEEGSFENGVPVDFKPEITNIQERYNAWNSITDENEKLKESRLYGKILNYEKALQQLTEFKKQQLVEELGWTKEGPKDLAKFINFVEKQLTREEISDNELEFIDALKDAQIVNFDLSNFGPQIEKILTAVVNKRLIRQKVNGEALIQASSVGFEKAGKFRNATEEERRKYSGTNDLKFYTPGEPMEVKISIQGQFKKLLNLPEVKKIAKENNVDALSALNIVIKDEKWLAKNSKMITMLGVRIPVQGLNSMEVMRVAEFLPEEAGNMIIPPVEIVAKSGADFDIDKLSIQMPNLRWEGLKGASKLTVAGPRSIEQVKELYQNLKKKAIEVEEFKTINSTVDEFGNLVYDKDIIRKALNRDVSKTVSRYSKDIELSNKLLNAVMSSAFGENWNELGYTEDEISDILKNYNLSKTEEEFIEKMNNEAAYENQLLYTAADIILDPENFVSLITPNSTSIVKPISDELQDKNRVYSSKKRFNGEANGFSPTRVYEPLYNLAKLEYNSVGKQALGIGAVDNTFNTIYNRIGAYMSDVTIINSNDDLIFNRLLLPHNTISVDGETRISLSHLYDKNGVHKISDLFNQLMNGWVDVEKDEWIFDLQGNKELTPSLLFLIQAGVPIKQAVLLLSQPIIREYVTDVKSRKGTFSSVLNKKSDENMHNVDARDTILFTNNDKYGFGLNQLNFLPDNEANGIVNQVTGEIRPAKNKIFNYVQNTLSNLSENYFSEKALKDNLDNLNASKTKDQYTEFDRNVFMHFLEILEMGKGQTEIKQAVKYDNIRSASLYDARVQLKKDIKAARFRGFDPDMYASILKNSPIGSFKIQEFMLDLYEPFFPLTNSQAFNHFLNKNNIENYISKAGAARVSFTDKKKVVGEFRKQLAPYIFYNWYFSLDSGNYYRGRYLDTNFEVVGIPYARRAAIYKDGKIYIDNQTIIENLQGAFYASEAQYFDADVAPLPHNIFDKVDAESMYKKYLFERESLRSLAEYQPNNVVTSQEYKMIRKNLSEQYLDKTVKIKGVDTVVDQNTVNLWAYETYLRNHALNNMNLPSWTFMGPNSYAYQYDNIISNSKYSKLVDYYPLLEALEVDVMPGKNVANVNTLRFRDTLLDIDQKNLYSENIQELKNPQILVEKFGLSEVDAQNISKFFNRFDIVAYLQSASNPNSTFSILSIADSKVISNMISEPISKFIDTVSQLESIPNTNNAVTDLLFDRFRNVFIATNNRLGASLAKRFRTFHDPEFAKTILSSNKDAIISNFIETLQKRGFTFDTQNEEELLEEIEQKTFVDDYKYYGRFYKIQVVDGVAVDVIDYKSKKSAKEKLLKSYNNNPNVDPQNNQAFREVKSTVNNKPVGTSTSESMTFANGTVINTPFKLNDQQTEALLELERFLKNPEAYNNQITLKGYAGTGKTSIIQIFDKYLKLNSLADVIYTSPTNRANAVTKLKNPKAKVYTLHTLFGLSPDFDFDAEYDLTNLNFAQRNIGKLKPNEEAILILDETSMVADGLFDFIEQEKKKNPNLKVIYMGDPAQLRPVKQDHISKTFEKGTQLELTKVERTGDNPILEESTNLRNGKDLNYKTKVKDGIGVVYGDNNTFVQDAIKENFLSPEFQADKLYFRILSATNTGVSKINQDVRKLLYGEEKAKTQLLPGDILMGKSNWNRDYKTSQYVIMNSGDYEVLTVEPSEKVVTLESGAIIFKGYDVIAKNLLADSKTPNVEFFVVDNNEEDSKIIRLSKEIKSLREKAAIAKREGEASKAAQLFDRASNLETVVTSMKPVIQDGRTLFNQTFDYGYAHTIHKSQGGTYSKVLILDDTINRFQDKNVQQELKYVAVSRATDKVYIATSHKLGTPEITGEEPVKETAQAPVSAGVEISSNAKGLAAALTNPTELAKSKGNLTESYPIEFRGKTYKDSEAAYQSLKSTATKDSGPNSTYNLMVDIIKAKLQQYPKLVAEITNQGGSSWILSSTHQPTNKNTVWETGGQNWFIKALNDAYVSVNQQKAPASTNVNMSEIVNHSGGAYGADTFWDIIGREFGVTKHNHYRDSGNTGLSSKLKSAGTTATILSKAEMDKARAEVKRILGEEYPDTLEGNLQVRNYYQVANSDGVFAIAQLSTDKSGVSGGTNTAVQLGIQLNKPVYVWDIATKTWYKHNGNKFEVTSTPTLTKNFAGVGSRDIESYNTKNKETGKWEPRKQYKGIEVEEAAKQAIREVYQKTATEGLQKVTPATSPSDMNKPKQVKAVPGFVVGNQIGTNVPVFSFSISPASMKPADLESIKNANPDVIFVTDAVMARRGGTPNLSGINETTAVLSKLGPDNHFGIPTKFFASPIDPKTNRPKGTINKTTNEITPTGLLSDEEYDYNVQQIEAAITALQEKAAANPNKVLRFSNSGIGMTMINRSELNTAEIVPTGKNVLPNPKTAEKTFVYLSKRLYEVFGYVNPGSISRRYAQGSVEMTEAVQRNQEVSDTDVTNNILNELLNCSI